MRNELAFQTKLVNTVDDMGGHAFKSNNRFKAGILDIHVTKRRNEGGVMKPWSAFIECKFERRASLVFKLAATPKQQQFARDEIKAGGTCIGLCWVQHSKDKRLWKIVQFDVTAKSNDIGVGDDGLDLTWNDHRCKMSEELARFL